MTQERSRKRANALNKQNEKILAADPQIIRTLTPAGIQKLIHELNVHQIELETQNEELRRAQLELQETRDKYLDLYDFSPTGYFTLDHKGLIVDVNLAGSELLGSEKGRLIGTQFTASISPDSQDAFYFHYREVLKTGLKDNCELKILKTDGTPFHAQLICSAVPEKNGTINHCRVAVIDITERMNSENKLRALSQHQETILAAIPDIITEVDNDKIYTWVNQAGLEFFGEDVLGKEASSYFLGEQDTYQLVQPVFNGQQETVYVESWQRRKNGEKRLLAWWSRALKDIDGNMIGALSAARDITERRHKETILEEEAIRRRILIEQSRDGIVVLDYDGKVYEANRQFARMLGYSPEEVKQLHVWDWEYLVTPERVLEMIRSVDEKGDHFETRHRRQDGTIYDVEISTNGATFTGQKLVFCVCRDISERKKAEEQLRYQASLVDNVTDAIYSRDLNFKILSWNKAAERMFGWKAGEIIGQDIRTLCSIDFLNTNTGTIDRELSEKGYWRGEAIYRYRGGTSLDVSISSIIVKDSEGQAAFAVVIVTDITEDKKLEEERERSAKLESIGTLAGGIAHDFNNVLTGILGNIQLAHVYLQQNKADTAQEMLAEAEKASLRARDLTQQLLTFSRGGAPVKKVILIDRLIRESATFALRGSAVKPEFSLPDNLWAVEADEGQLNQVINNLVINADQAMPNGGIINVSASNVVIKKQHALPLPDGSYIEIAVKDHGIGIPEGNKGRIFEPYFTTKQKGSGLGLATSYSIIKNHGGCITFESELGVGTTFHIYLPASKEKVKQEREELAPPPLPLAQGRILVMDDEDMIRMVLSRMLQGAGYEVEVSSDGAEALQKYIEAGKSGKPFDAVILDLTVPGGMGGKEAIGKLLEIDPGVKAIVSSGYATDSTMADFKIYGFSAVVAKPYVLRELLSQVRTVLKQA